MVATVRLCQASEDIRTPALQIGRGRTPARKWEAMRDAGQCGPVDVPDTGRTQ
jgi:hypothetical protein